MNKTTLFATNNVNADNLIFVYESHKKFLESISTGKNLQSFNGFWDGSDLYIVKDNDLLRLDEVGVLIDLRKSIPDYASDMMNVFFSELVSGGTADCYKHINTSVYTFANTIVSMVFERERCGLKEKLSLDIDIDRGVRVGWCFETLFMTTNQNEPAIPGLTGFFKVDVTEDEYLLYADDHSNYNMIATARNVGFEMFKSLRASTTRERVEDKLREEVNLVRDALIKEQYNQELMHYVQENGKGTKTAIDSYIKTHEWYAGKVFALKHYGAAFPFHVGDDFIVVYSGPMNWQDVEINGVMNQFHVHAMKNYVGNRIDFINIDCETLREWK